MYDHRLPLYFFSFSFLAASAFWASSCSYSLIYFSISDWGKIFILVLPSSRVRVAISTIEKEHYD